MSLSLSDVRAIYRESRFAVANNCDGDALAIARYRVRIVVLEAECKARAEEIAQLQVERDAGNRVTHG